MNKNWHYLQPTKAAKLPERFAVLASVLEQVQFEGNKDKELVCRAWCLRVNELIDGNYEEEGSIVYPSLKSPIPWIEIVSLLERRKVLDVWVMECLDTLAATGFFQLIDDGFVVIKNEDWQGMATLTNPPVQILCRPSRGKGIMRILCLSNIGVKSYEQLGKFYKYSGDACHSMTLEPESWSFAAQVRTEYASLYLETWFNTIVEQKLGSIKTTIAAQAWSAYRHRFLKQPLLCHANQEATNLESDALIGGRAECFRIGQVNGPLYHYDVVSCYANIAKKEIFPCRLRALSSNGYSFMESCISGGYAVIADVTVLVTSPKFPKRVPFGTIFPIGRFRTVLAATELMQAIANKEIVKVHKVAAYETDAIFDKWVDFCEEYRYDCESKGDYASAKIVKLLRNSLWGRFAKRDRQWSNEANGFCASGWGEWFERDCEFGELQQYRCIGGLVQRLTDNGYNCEALPAITAWICSLGRSLLWKLMNIAGLKNVVYVATDSLIVNEIGQYNLTDKMSDSVVCGIKLDWKATYKSMFIRGIHHYDVDGKSVDAGVPDYAQPECGPDRHWSSTEPISSALFRSERPGARIIEKQRVSIGKYMHGRVQAYGGVLPFELGESDE